MNTNLITQLAARAAMQKQAQGGKAGYNGVQSVLGDPTWEEDKEKQANWRKSLASLGSSAKKLLGKGVSGGSKVLDDVGASAKKTLDKSIPAGAEAFGGTQTGKSLKDTTKSIGTYFDNMMSDSRKTVGEAWDSATSQAKGIASGAGESLGGAVDQAGKSLTDTTKSLGTYIDNMVSESAAGGSYGSAKRLLGLVDDGAASQLSADARDAMRLAKSTTDRGLAGASRGSGSRVSQGPERIQHYDNPASKKIRQMSENEYNELSTQIQNRSKANQHDVGGLTRSVNEVSRAAKDGLNLMDGELIPRATMAGLLLPAAGAGAGNFAGDLVGLGQGLNTLGDRTGDDATSYLRSAMHESGLAGGLVGGGAGLGAGIGHLSSLKDRISDFNSGRPTRRTSGGFSRGKTFRGGLKGLLGGVSAAALNSYVQSRVNGSQAANSGVSPELGKQAGILDAFKSNSKAPAPGLDSGILEALNANRTKAISAHNAKLGPSEQGGRAGGGTVGQIAGGIGGLLGGMKLGGRFAGRKAIPGLLGLLGGGFAGNAAGKAVGGAAGRASVPALSDIYKQPVTQNNAQEFMDAMGKKSADLEKQAAEREKRINACDWLSRSRPCGATLTPAHGLVVCNLG